MVGGKRVETEGERWVTDIWLRTRSIEEKGKKRGVEKITASLGHIIKQKNITSAREDDEKKGGSGFEAEGQRERASETELWVGKRNREGMTCLTTMRKKKKKIITSCYTVRVLRICQAGGYEKFEKEKKKGIKQNEVVDSKYHRCPLSVCTEEERLKYSRKKRRMTCTFCICCLIPPLPQQHYAAVPHAHTDTGFLFHYQNQSSEAQ